MNSRIITGIIVLVLIVLGIAAVVMHTPAREANPNPEVAGTSTAQVGAGCAVAGCSGIICTETENANDLVTTCEYRAEYACYKTARCEKQASGMCGWTQTPELTACLQNTFVESKG